MSGLLICKECREGKHVNCDGTAWSNELDTAAPCTCPDREHQRPTAEKDAGRAKGSTLAEFADEVDIEHPLTARRIPVLRGTHPRWKYHVALVIGRHDWQDAADAGIEPEPFEVDQLCAYLEKHMRYYNASYRAMVEGRGPFDLDSTVNTHIFRKHPEHGWQYNVASWTYGPRWFPTPPWHTVGPFTLEELLDRINTFGDDGPTQKWLDVKAESGAFPTRVLPPGAGS